MSVNHEQRAFRAWPILTTLAARRGVTTYGKLAKRIGIHHRALPYALAPIQDYCEQQGLPPLTILVRNTDTGEPGDGFYHWNRGRKEDVWAFDWASVDNPFESARAG